MFGFMASIPVLSLVAFALLFLIPWKLEQKSASVFVEKSFKFDRMAMSLLSAWLWRITRWPRCLEVSMQLAGPTNGADLIFRKLGGVDEKIIKGRPLLCNLYALALYEIGDYPEALRWHKLDYATGVENSKQSYALLRLSYMAAMCRQVDWARRFFFMQYDVKRRHWQDVGRRVWTALYDRIARDAIHNDIKRVGVFFLSSTDALGHAILDPYHFLALNRDRFDKIYFIGPGRAAYRAGSWVCIEIVEQYGEYVEVEDDLLLNLSWMDLGETTVRIGDLMWANDFSHIRETNRAGALLSGKQGYESFHEVELVLVVKNYWGLLRQVYRRHRDLSDAFEHNRWHFTLSEDANMLGEAICERESIDLAKPLVVLHMREPAYHQLSKQSFRDTDPKDYIPAIRYLLKRGWQVVRIGDRKMSRLRIHDRGYREAPFLKCYAPELDSFLISRATFMIGCQSGPCSFARVLGKPLLSVNAVFHYTLFPSPFEMACFKRYVHTKQSRYGVVDTDNIPISNVLEQGLFDIENTVQLRRRGIHVVKCTPKEILAAVEDMLRWTDEPDRPLTAEQAEFERLLGSTCEELNTRPALPIPVSDYLGIGLPGYTISPTVARMRRDPEVASRVEVSDIEPVTRPPHGVVAEDAVSTPRSAG